MNMSEFNLLSIPDAIQLTAQRFPDHVALEDNQGTLTYSQLLEQAGQISQYLIKENIAIGDRVLILMNQGKAAIAAMLGILQAGARFVPLDPKEPAERLSFIINNCQPKLLLTDSINEERLKNSLADQPLVNAENLPTIEIAAPLPALTPDHEAYIIYTSGSTGNPKGVCQNHRNLLHFANTYATTLGIQPQDRLSMLYSLNFSAANMDIYSGLLRGATICFYDLKNRGSSGLEQWLEDARISVLHTVPSVFRHLLHNTTKGHVYHHIRAIDLGGEAVYSSDIPLLKNFFTPECVCFNHLAATEASVIAQHKIDTHKEYPRGLLPVGPAANGMNIDLINEYGNSVPAEETAEIILESDFLSTGYWNLPEQTEKAFDVSSDGKRYYRSGDLGFFDNEGNLNYVGRNDFRVKIHGQTIELGEIEAALLTIPGIDEAVAVAWQADEEAEKKLIAFYLADNGAINAGFLRKSLQESLPPYMIPAWFIHRENFPQTSTGKIDRKKLMPEPGELVMDENAIDLPKTVTEKHVAQIFAVILKTDKLDRNLTFFDLGGDSMQAMNLVMLLEKNYQIDIPLELVNNNSSIASIAQYLEDEIARAKEDKPSKGPAYESLLMPLILHNKPLNLFLVHGRDGHAMISPNLGSLMAEKHNLYVLRARGLKHGERPNLSIEGMAAEYIHEIRRVQPEGPYYLSGLCAGCIIALEMARQLKRCGEIVKPVIVFDPPIRAVKPIPMDQKRQMIRQMHRQLQEYKMEDYQNLARGLEKRIAAGKLDIDVNDEQVLGATAHVVVGMNIAMHTYRPHHPYQGEVLILCSKDRFESKQKNGDTLISGRLKHFIVGKSHNDVLDPKNPHFITALKQCLEIATRAPNVQ